MFDRIVDSIIVLLNQRTRISKSFASFLEKGKNGLILFSLILFVPFAFLSQRLYVNYESILLAVVPWIFYFLIIVFLTISFKVKNHLEHGSGSKITLVGLGYDFNERVLRRIYISLIKHEFLDENKTNFQDFYNVLVKDFADHESVLHFNCTQPQLKYILEKFKYFKRGIHLTTFERSGKFYNKGKLIVADSLSKKYSEFPPTKEFEDLIDSIFDFLGEV